MLVEIVNNARDGLPDIPVVDDVQQWPQFAGPMQVPQQHRVFAGVRIVLQRVVEIRQRLAETARTPLVDAGRQQRLALDPRHDAQPVTTLRRVDVPVGDPVLCAHDRRRLDALSLEMQQGTKLEVTGLLVLREAGDLDDEAPPIRGVETKVLVAFADQRRVIAGQPELRRDGPRDGFLRTIRRRSRDGGKRFHGACSPKPREV